METEIGGVLRLSSNYALLMMCKIEVFESKENRNHRNGRKLHETFAGYDKRTVPEGI
jgi:hypothetical protein